MNFDEIKPNTPGWNQIKSEMTRNITFFEILEKKTNLKQHSSKGIQLMKDALAVMNTMEKIPETTKE